MLYFGYGSNLDSPDLAAWCRARGLPGIDLAPVGSAFLPDRRLAFTHRSTTRGGGVLDIPDAVGCAVHGVLFRAVSDDAIALLDRKESEGHAYRRIETVALTEDGGEAPVFAYEVVPERRETFVTPARSYLEIVRRGYAAHGLALAPLESAARGERDRGPVTNLFVYGTLLPGEERHPVLARHGSRPRGAASTAGTLVDLGPYPGLLLGVRNNFVAGELYEATDPEALFAELDEVETFRGHGVAGSLYRRVIVRVQGAGSGVTTAWTYVYAGDRNGCQEIVSGDWRARGRP